MATEAWALLIPLRIQLELQVIGPNVRLIVHHRMHYFCVLVWLVDGPI